MGHNIHILLHNAYHIVLTLCVLYMTITKRSKKIWVGWGNFSILNQGTAVFLTQVENFPITQEKLRKFSWLRYIFSWLRKIFDLGSENGYFLIQVTTITSTHSYFFAPCSFYIKNFLFAEVKFSIWLSNFIYIYILISSEESSQLKTICF